MADPTPPAPTRNFKEIAASFLKIGALAECIEIAMSCVSWCKRAIIGALQRARQNRRCERHQHEHHHPG